MKIPTANIVVAYNKETMERLFSEGATYKSLVAELSDDQNDALMFNNVANPNFLSFEHAFGLGGGFKMKLSFIDPKGEFEKRFLTLDIVELIQGTQNPKAQKTKGFITDKPQDVEQSQSDYSEEYIAQYKEELRKAVGQKEIYVAYGTGNNLKLWSGPHKTVVTSAEITMKGSKKVDLELTPTPQAFDILQRRGSYNEVLNLNLQGLTIRYAGQSQEIEFTEEKAYDPIQYITYGEDINAKQKAEEYKEDVSTAILDEAEGSYGLLRLKLRKYDFHCMVTDAIRSYVQKATSNSNVIVLLPDLNLTCRQAIREEANNYRLEGYHGLSTEGIASTLAEGGFASQRVDDIHDKALTTLGRDELFVESILKRFGLKLHSGKKEILDDLSPRVTSFGPIGTLAANEEFPSADAAVEGHYNDRFYTAVVDKTDRAVPDHKAVIDGILDNISKLSGESYSFNKGHYFTESDHNILKVWGSPKWSKHYTLAGYDDFTEDSCAVIVGDTALIKQYLYGGIDLNESQASIDEIRQNIDATKDKLAYDQQEAMKLELADSILVGTSSGLQSEIDAKQSEINAGEASIEEDAINAALVHPLNPMDKIILTNNTYNKDIREAAYRNLDKGQGVKGSGAFGDISDIPDDFAYADSDLSQSEKDHIRETGIPIFRHNTQNPNVLDLKFNFGGVYFAQLVAGYHKEVSRLASTVAEGVLPTGIGSFPIRSRGSAIAYLRSRQFSTGMPPAEQRAVIASLTNRIAPELAEEMGLNNTAAASDKIAAMIRELEKDNLKGLIQVDQELAGTPNTVLTDLSEDLYAKAFQITITTLPTFHISTQAYINTPSIVFAQDQPISQTVRNERSLMNKFFSGLYRIMSYKHTINSSGAKSEFGLTKIMTS
jgi:hypothetical protein